MCRGMHLIRNFAVRNFAAAAKSAGDGINDVHLVPITHRLAKRGITLFLDAAPRRSELLKLRILAFAHVFVTAQSHHFLRRD